MTFSARAQIQQAWVARYNNGILIGTNQAVKMALDSAGNICVTGFSQNANSNLGYVTIKYAPNGNQLWATRYDDTNFPTAKPAGLALDNSNNLVVTGSALTIKYDTKGQQLWTAPYAGTALAVDSNANVAVTGFDTMFSTVKLNASGTNLWREAYPPLSCAGSTATAQSIVADTGGQFYVAGNYTWICDNGYAAGDGLRIIKYSVNGNQIWTTFIQIGDAPAQVGGLALDGAGNVDVLASFVPAQSFNVLAYDSSGNLVWSVILGNDVLNRGQAVAIDSEANVLVTGQCFAYDDITAAYGYGSFKVGAGGNTIWTNYFPRTPLDSTSATSIAVDFANNSYVTGYSPGTNGTNDIVTIKYDPNGNMIWLQRYSSPSGGYAAGNAVAVDSNGNVYVTGYDTTAEGGTEIVTIKYSPVALQRLSDGTVLFQAQGAPGESFDIEASTNLLDWLDLGTILADTNGLIQFDDTNAPNYPSRFYYASPQ